MPTFFSLFTGGDLAGIGAKMAGCEIIGGVEYDPAIAEVARLNGCENITVAPVEATDPRKTCPQSPDFLWASPVCKRASNANTHAGETHEDIQTAEAVCNYIRVLKPRFFFLENVQGYMKFEAFARIRAALDSLGYFSHAQVLNSADYGVPQTRRRLILRASREGFLPQLPPPTPWRGWYDAIEDLIPTLPESQFAQWQLDRLPENLFEDFLTTQQYANSANSGERTLQMRKAHEPSNTVMSSVTNFSYMRAYLVGGANTSKSQASPGVGVSTAQEPTHCVNASNSDQWRAFICHDTEMRHMPVKTGDEPIWTLKSNVGRASHGPRAFIMDGRNTRTTTDEPFTVCATPEPMFTVTASDGAGRHKAFIEGMERSQAPLFESREWLKYGRVVKMTPRALARFMSLPDSYILPEKNALACTIVGNGVPCLLSQRIIEQFLN